MTLISKTYGKARVRVLRLHKTGPRQEPRELTIQAMITGDFAGAFVDADNAKMVSTDTIKNVINIVARKNLALDTEDFCCALADTLLSHYPQIETTTIDAHETKWDRLSFTGTPHDHAFVRDGNGQPYVQVVASRAGREVTSGVSDFTFMKTTASAWDKFAVDPYTTIPPTRDRICATAMAARWRWRTAPADYVAANKLILSTLLDVFSNTYSESVQDSLYRMGRAALDKVPELIDISMACPNKHYLLINLEPFGLDNDNVVFLPTDEPHGQIACTVGR